MFDVVLSKDAEKVICIIYKDYLERRKNGEPKRNAQCYTSISDLSARLFPKLNELDLQDTINELARCFNFKRYTAGGFVLSDDAIIYMENRFKNGLVEVISFIAQFIP